jgi:hypothetical protein
MRFHRPLQALRAFQGQLPASIQVRVGGGAVSTTAWNYKGWETVKPRWILLAKELWAWGTWLLSI